MSQRVFHLQKNVLMNAWKCLATSPKICKTLCLTCLPHLWRSSAVRRGREESRCSWPDPAVLRSAGRQPGMRGHLTSARLPQRHRQPDVRGHAQHGPPQSQSQHQQQQRPVRAQPQHQHHVGESRRMRKTPEPTHPTPPLPSTSSSVSHCVTQNRYQRRDIRRDGHIVENSTTPERRRSGCLGVRTLYSVLYYYLFLVLFVEFIQSWSEMIMLSFKLFFVFFFFFVFLFFKRQPNKWLTLAFIPTLRKAFP